MGLFEKKYCDFCGNKLGLFGHTKLEDGYICKDCLAKLSPWWQPGKKTKASDVHEHLMDREENKTRVAGFRVSRSLGSAVKVLVDDAAGQVMITSSADFSEANPDVFNISDITSASLEISDSKIELKDKDKDGKTVSFDPKRYEYRYDFYINAYVKNRWFDHIRFRLNGASVKIDPWAEYAEKKAEYDALQRQHLGAAPVTKDPYKPDIEGNADYQEYKAIGEEIAALLSENQI